MTKSQEWKIKHALKLHHALMVKYEHRGFNREDASRKAYEEMSGNVIPGNYSQQVRRAA